MRAAAFAALVLVLAGCSETDYADSGSPQVAEPMRVTVEEVGTWMVEGVPIVFLDSRSSGAWDSAETKLPGAVRVPPTDVASHLSEIPTGRTVVAYCT